MDYIALGMKRDIALSVTGITKHQYNHKPKKGKRGIQASTHTTRIVDEQEVNIPNTEVVEQRVTSPLYNHRYKNHQRSHLAESKL